MSFHAGFADELIKLAEDQVFHAQGKNYSVQKLWGLAQKLPSKRMTTRSRKFRTPVDAGWGHDGVRPVDVLKNPESHPEHARRINRTDLRRPVILSPEGWVVDGMHRMAKALKKGSSSVRYRQFRSFKQMEPALIKKARDCFFESASKAALSKKYTLMRGKRWRG